MQVQQNSLCKRSSGATQPLTASALSQSVEEMPKKAAKESNGASAPVEAQDDRVASLRKEMAKHDVQAYIVPSEDPHMVGQSIASNAEYSWK